MWAAREVRLHGHALLFLSAYFAFGEGLSGDNMQMLEEMVSKIQATGVPFILMADWSMEVSEVRESGIEDFLDARFVFPKGASWEFGKRVIDFGLVSSHLVPDLTLEYDL